MDWLAGRLAPIRCTKWTSAYSAGYIEGEAARKGWVPDEPAAGLVAARRGSDGSGDPPMIEPKPPIIWKAGNAVLITFRNETVLGLITRASWNAASLLLQFDGKLGDHAGTMPVLLSRRGDYRSIVTDELVTLQRPE
jgi:hypothetical protein